MRYIISVLLNNKTTTKHVIDLKEGTSYYKIKLEDGTVKNGKIIKQ